MFRFWERRGHFQEGCAWLEQALAAAANVPPQYRGRALNALTFLYWRGGNAERAQSIAEEALGLNRRYGRTVDVAWALGNLGMVAYLRHEHELAVARLEESVRLAREAGHLPLLSVALTFVGRTRMWVNGPSDPLAARGAGGSVCRSPKPRIRCMPGVTRWPRSAICCGARDRPSERSRCGAARSK